MEPRDIMALLGLEPHPAEGGFFRETYRDARQIAKGALGGDYDGARAASTAIYYMLTPGTVSAMHRLKSDEVFHFYLGDPVEMLHLRGDGAGQILLLGTELTAGMRPQVVVPRGVWQGARLRAGGKFALLGCTVAPGFEYADYEHGERNSLLESHPEFGEMIRALTK